MVRGVRRRFDAGLVLLLTPLLWGITFPAGKIALRYLPPLTFMAWSRVLGLLTILAFVPLLRGTDDERARGMRAVARPGLLLGLLIFVGYTLQTEGLARTTATNAGFITGLYVVFTPILAAAIFRQRIPRGAWGAVALSLAGLALLSIKEVGQIHPHAGDLLVAAAAVVWAGHITAVGHYSPRHSSWRLSRAQRGWTAVFQVIAALFVGLRVADAASSSVWPLLIVTGVLGSGVAFTIQVMGQQSITASRAVILLAGESLFSALAAALWIGERLSARQWAGAALVLAAMAYSELSARRPPGTLVEPASAE